MSTTLNEKLFYDYDSKAMNLPEEFIASQSKYLKKQHCSPISLRLNGINALLVTGKLDDTFAALKAIKDDIESSGIGFYRCRYHLLRYKALTLTDKDPEMAKLDWEDAQKYRKMSAGIGLDAELQLIMCIKNFQDQELTKSEELLQTAMQAALQSTYPELIMDVYLAFIQLYLTHNLPERASQELLIFEDMINPETQSLKYTQMLNLKGLMNSMLRLHPEACKIFEQGIEIAQSKGYVFQLAQLCMNMGITSINMGNYVAGIELYDKALELLSGNKDYQHALISNILMNKAKALSINGQLDESIALMQQTLEMAERTGKERWVNILKVNLADVVIEKEDFAFAESLLDQATEYFGKHRLYDMLQNCYLCKARLYEVKGDYQSAFNSMEELYGCSKRHFQENFIKQSHRYSKRIEDLRNEYFLLKNQCSHNEMHASMYSHTDLIGEHPLIKKALSDALQAAKYPNVNVHIYGESGTGKEIIARIIHEAGQTGKQMVAINAAAISPNLIESELFGHVKGAFTGAINDHKGKFLLANKGSLFLDEISDMPLDCQAKLLRAIEHRSIIPVGSDKEISVNCRIISASNKKLPEMVRANLFRLDLYHRLNKVEIYLPALRERSSDLELLTTYFVKRFAKEFHHPLPIIGDCFVQRLQRHRFPGNVRELMNIIERIFILKPKPYWYADQLDGLIEDVEPALDSEISITDNLRQKEEQLILETLTKVNWVQKEAAKILGMTESTLSRHIKKLGLRR